MPFVIVVAKPIKNSSPKAKGSRSSGQNNCAARQSNDSGKASRPICQNLKVASTTFLLRLSSICQTVTANIILAATPGSIAVKSIAEPAEIKSKTEKAAKLNNPAFKIQTARFSGKGLER